MTEDLLEEYFATMDADSIEALLEQNWLQYAQLNPVTILGSE